MIQRGALAYYGKTKGTYTPIKPAGRFTERKDRLPLLWGDEMYVISIDYGEATVSAKGQHLRIPIVDLRDSPLLSIYQIDCGQGDSALIHFPDGRWMMVDGGPARGGSNSGKIATDFLAWKMFKDQSWKNEFNFMKQPLRIEAVVCTHSDIDHYGGFMELNNHIERKTLEFGSVCHNGLGRFDGVPGRRLRTSPPPGKEHLFGISGRPLRCAVDLFDRALTFY